MTRQSLHVVWVVFKSIKIIISTTILIHVIQMRWSHCLVNSGHCICKFIPVIKHMWETARRLTASDWYSIYIRCQDWYLCASNRRLNALQLLWSRCKINCMFGRTLKLKWPENGRWTTTIYNTAVTGKHNMHLTNTWFPKLFHNFFLNTLIS